MRTLAILAAFFAASSPVFAQVKAPPLPDEKADKVPGITLTLTGGGKTDTRKARLLAFHVPKGQAPSPFIPAGPFVARWEGEIESPLRNEYTFKVEIQGSFKMTLNGQVLFEGAGDTTSQIMDKTVQLNKGGNRFVAELISDGSYDATVQLSWSSEEFPMEPVPPSAFVHDASAKPLREGLRIREGRLLFAQNRCTACHAGGDFVPAPGQGMPELAQDAPTFDELGSKFNEAFLAHWINDPYAIRPHTLMPRVFPVQEGKIDQRAADLAAFLVSIGQRDDTAPAEENAPLGGALFANFGCIACHTPPGFSGDDEFDRVPLNHIKAKWQPKALREFLKNPQQRYRHIRMPNFRLTDEEAERITAFLLSGDQKEFPAGPKGDPAKGAQLLVTANCINCHAGTPPTTTPTLADTLKSGWTKGCLAPEPTARGTAPDFNFTADQRGALLAFAASGFDSLKQDAPVEFAHRQLKNLRCNSCHSLDDQPSTWSHLEGEMIPLVSAAPSSDDTAHEGTVQPWQTPALTWLGEKLQPMWMAKFIAGAPLPKPRPWLISRMPGFELHAHGLAEGLAHAHGFGLSPKAESEQEKPAPVKPEIVAAGKQLIGADGGFNCIQCHGVGDQAATAVFEAPGPNLAFSSDRLRHGYFMRWMKAPLRVDPETKMPKFSEDGETTALTEVLDGKAPAQFEAIWHYLGTLKAKP